MFAIYTTERFAGVFMGYKTRTLAKNELTTISELFWINLNDYWIFRIF